MKITLLRKWSGDYPVSQLGRLPQGQQHLETGYIADLETFLPVWRAFMPTEMLPPVDFTRNFILFTRNVRFYNQKFILSIMLEEGIAEIVAIETMSSKPIDGRIAMAMAVVPRDGITAIRSGSSIIEVRD